MDELLKVEITVIQSEDGNLRIKVTEQHSRINILTVMGVMDEAKRLVLKSVKQNKLWTTKKKNAK